VSSLIAHLRAWIVRCGALFGARRRDRELSAELDSHLQMHIDDNLRAGMSPAEARRRALIHLGGIEQAKEACRDRHGLPWLETLFQDVRFGLRMLRKNPGFTAIVIVTLALGLGLNTAIFSLIDGFLLRPLPVRHPEQIAALAVQGKDTPLGALGLSYPEFVDFRGQSDSFSAMFANVLGTAALQANDRTDQLPISYVSANFFSTLGLNPALGRLILPGGGEASGETPSIVLGYSFWKRRFGGDAGVIGKQVRLNGKPAVILGVAPKDFHGMFFPFEMDGYVPLNALAIVDSSSRFTVNRSLRRILAFGRLKPGVSLRQAQNSLDVISLRLARQYPATDAGIGLRALPEKLARPQPYANRIFLLIGGLFLAFAGLVLLLACLNVTNAMFARAAARQREIAVRAALGATRGRLVRQILTETISLALFGAVCGLGLAAAATRLLPAVRFPDFPLRLDFSFDWRVYAFALAAAVLAGIVSGLPIALRASRSDVHSSLRDAWLGRGNGKHRLHSDLVVAQIACSLTLLVAAVLLVRGLQRIETTNLGFDPRNLLNVVIDPSEAGYDQARTEDFYRELQDRIRALPGVQSASLAGTVPIGAFPARTPVFSISRPLSPDQQPPSILFNAVDPGYFSTMKISLLRGRDFTREDRHLAPLVAIVNQTMAGQFWPRQDPVGKTFRLRSPAAPLVQVVGVAEDGKYQTVTESPQPYFYVPLLQHYTARRVLEIRCRVFPGSLSTLVQRQVRALAPGVSIVDLRTMEQSLQGGTGYYIFRLGASLAMQMGILGLLLATAGVYGVISFVVTLRTHEIGIRMALGAAPRSVLMMVLRQGILLIGLGTAIGLASAALVSRAMSHLSAAVQPTDVVSYAAATAALAAVALLACWIPARRAMRVDPMVALRHE
jgi:putative ABC transport system permease protein